MKRWFEMKLKMTHSKFYVRLWANVAVADAPHLSVDAHIHGIGSILSVLVWFHIKFLQSWKFVMNWTFCTAAIKMTHLSSLELVEAIGIVCWDIALHVIRNLHENKQIWQFSDRNRCEMIFIRCFRVSLWVVNLNK